MSSRSRDWLRNLASVGVSVLLLGLVAWRADLRGVLAELSSVDLRWALVAALLGPLQIVLGGLRWRAALAGFGREVTARWAIGEVGLSGVLNQVLPGGLAGDAVRVWRERSGGLGAPVQAAVVERWIGLWIHCLVTLGCWGTWVALDGGRTADGVVVGLVLIGLTAVGFVPGRIGRNVRSGLSQTGVPLLGLSTGLTASFLLAFTCAGLALGHEIGSWVLALPLVLLAMAIPLSVGGWGLREVAAVSVLPRMGWSPEEALAVSSLYGVCSFVGSLPGLFAVRWTGR